MEFVASIIRVVVRFYPWCPILEKRETKEITDIT
jgi:hypothetical protein